MTPPCYKTLEESPFGSVGVLADETKGLQDVTRVFRQRNFRWRSPVLQVRAPQEGQERIYELVLS